MSRLSRIVSRLALSAVISAGGLVALSTATLSTAMAQPADAGLEIEPENAKAGPPSKTLERAVKLYDGAKGNNSQYLAATIELHKVISGESGDDAGNKQRAEFFMGKALHQLGFFAGALAYFDAIVQAGPSHAYHGATLKWLAALSRVLPETSGILEKIGSYDVAALDEPIMAEVRDELYYLLGRHYFRRGGDGDFDKSIELFGRVSRDNPFFIKAKFFTGVTHVRKLEGKPAVDAFKEILVIASEKPAQYTADDLYTYEQLALLQMARVFYSNQQFDTSIKYFEKIDQDNADWSESLFEASWAYFLKTNMSKALGNIHTLNSPFFENEFFPESVQLRAVIYFNYCLYDRALEAIQEYDAKYRPLRTNLDELNAKYEDNAEFYEYIKKVMAGTAGLDDQTQRLVMSVLNDKTLKKEFAWVDELQKELDMMSKTDKAWQTTAVAAQVNQELTLQKSLADGNAGKVARDRIQRLAAELGRLSRDGRKIQIEILGAMADKVSTEATVGQVSSNRKEDPIVVDDEHFMWKFNGEYWKDELGYYRFKVRSKCAKK